MARLRATPGWATLAVVVVLSALLRWWAASRVPTPWIIPDEVLYAKLGESLYAHGTFELLGQPMGYYSLVYPALVGLPLSLHDLILGYDLLKPIQALVMSLAAVPVYVWARRLVPTWWALAAAALTVTIPGLAYTGLIMTEVAFYPVAALACLAMAAALVDPTLRNQAFLVGALLLAAATRLQGAVLAAVFVTALVLVAIFERDARRVRSLWPALAAICLAGVGWAAWRLSGGGPASEIFAGYRAAGETHYSVGGTLRFVRYHVANVLLMTGVVPVCAVALLAIRAFAGRERDRETRAFVAVAVALVVWLVVEVGLFASVHVHRLAERDLLAVCPVLFVGLCVWLARGAPRPPVQTASVGAVALVFVLWLPVGTLVSHAAIPDAFTLIPLYRLRVHRPDVDLQLVVDVLAAIAVVVFALVPRRLLWALPIVLGLVLSAISFSAGRVVASEATIVRETTLGKTRRWIDAAATGPVAYVYSGEAVFSSVYENLFWNRKLTAVYSLNAAKVPLLDVGKQPAIGPLPDGKLILADGRPVDPPNVVASYVLGFRGRQLTYAFAPALVLWQAKEPLSLDTWLLEENAGDGVFSLVRMLVYDCRGGTLRLRLTSPVAQRVTLTGVGSPTRRVALDAGASTTVTIEARPRTAPAKTVCLLAARPQKPLAVDDVRFAPAVSGPARAATDP